MSSNETANRAFAEGWLHAGTNSVADPTYEDCVFGWRCSNGFDEQVDVVIPNGTTPQTTVQVGGGPPIIGLTLTNPIPRNELVLNVNGVVTSDGADAAAIGVYGSLDLSLGDIQVVPLSEAAYADFVQFIQSGVGDNPFAPPNTVDEFDVVKHLALAVPYDDFYLSDILVQCRRLPVRATQAAPRFLISA